MRESEPITVGLTREQLPCGLDPWMTRRLFFAKGWTLCVRDPRPRPCRGISLAPMVGRPADGPMGGGVSAKPRPSFAGVRSPPLRGVASPARMALRGKAGDGPNGGFLGGMRSVRPQRRARRKPKHRMVMEGQTNARWPKGESHPGPLPLALALSSDIEIEEELVRVRPHSQSIDLIFPLVADPRLYHILGEDITLEKKLMILFQGL